MFTPPFVLVEYFNSLLATTISIYEGITGFQISSTSYLTTIFLPELFHFLYDYSMLFLVVGSLISITLTINLIFWFMFSEKGKHRIEYINDLDAIAFEDEGFLHWLYRNISRFISRCCNLLNYLDVALVVKLTIVKF